MCSRSKLALWILSALASLAALASLPAAGQALTGPGTIDPVFTQTADGSFIVPNLSNVSVNSGVDLVAIDHSVISIVFTGNGVTVQRFAWHQDGSAEYGVPVYTTAVPFDVTSAVVVNGVLYLSALTQGGPVVYDIDIATGKPPAFEFENFVHHLSSPFSDSTVTPLDVFLGLAFGATSTKSVESGDAAATPVAVVVSGASASQADHRSTVYLFDPATGAVVPTFGNGGSVTIGNFYARWATATPTGIVVGGVSYLDPAHPGIGVVNLDLAGKPGSCGSTVREVLPRTAQFVLPDTTGGYYDRVLDVVTFVGQANGTQFYARQLKADCTLNATTFTYPNKVFAGRVTGVTAGSMAVVLNDTGNGTSAARVALFDTQGGAPTAISPVISAIDTATAGKPVAGGNTVANRVAVEPNGKILVAGTTDTGGGAAFVARYIGVQTTTGVVEFFNTNLKHYFITADPNEAAAIDAGAAGPGWSRTGQTFRSGGPNRVCRFYGVQAAGGPNGHFYTISDAECGAVMLDPGWNFESYDFSGWPMNADRSCRSGTIPVKRAYNGRFAQQDSNHRYATSDTIYNQMLAQGWSGEGVVFCAPQ